MQSIDMALGYHQGDPVAQLEQDIDNAEKRFHDAE